MINKNIPIDKFEKSLGVVFKDKKFLIEALTHRSSANEDREISFSNERLEFLGDSVLSIIVSTFLYKKYPDFPEGRLTSLRSILVQSKSLAKVSVDLGAGEFLTMSKGEELSGGRSNTSILADTLEAIIGAIYLDLGLEAAERFVSSHLLTRIDELLVAVETVDYKSRLQEKSQEKERVSPRYEVIKTEGPDHNKQFYVDVFVADVKKGEGSGKSKQEAEQAAAKNALEKNY